jgi:Ca2+-binding RTX toxin-like protein
LESRQLLSSATLASGVLRVRGDDGVRDVIALRLNENQSQIIVTINDVDLSPFEASSVTRITVNGKGDHDNIRIDEVNGRLVGFKIELYGGEGNDTIRGGKDKIKVYGEAGDDRLLDVRGYIEGGVGNDSIEGSVGKDYIFAGEGNDFVDGEEGNDVIWGGPGNDRLEGDEGNDLVFGEDGEDTLTGGTGNDRLYGNAGVDRIFGEDGDDSMFGGRHEDIIEGGLGGNDIRTYGEYEKIEKLMKNQLTKAKAYV